MFKNLGHFFATVAHGIVTGAIAVKSTTIKVAQVTAAHQDDIAQVENVVNGIAAVADPAAVPVLQAMEHIFGDVLAAIMSAGDAATQNGLSITLDKTAVEKAKIAINTIAAKGQ